MPNFSRRLGFLFPLLIGACTQPAPAPAPPAADTQADVAAINAVREHEAAMVVFGTADSMAPLYTDDVVMMPPGEPAVVGKAAMTRWATDLFAQVGLTVSYTSSQVTVSGDLAVDHFTGTLVIAPKAGGAPATETIKGVHVMRREAGGWKIAQDVWNADTAPAAPAPAPAATKVP